MKRTARRTYSHLCERYFASQAEAERGEDLFLEQKNGKISDLQYQVRIDLCDIPQFKTFIKIDFKYRRDDQTVYEDVKGTYFTRVKGKARPFVDREFRTKLAWLKDKHGIDVVLIKDK